LAIFPLYDSLARANTGESAMAKAAPPAVRRNDLREIDEVD